MWSGGCSGRAALGAIAAPDSEAVKLCRYLERRDSLRAACARAAALAHARPAAWTVKLLVNALPAAGLLIAPVALLRFDRL